MSWLKRAFRLLALFSLLFSSSLLAWEIQAGELIKVEGKVWIINPDGTQHLAQIGETVKSEQVIETREGGKAVLVFDDGSELEIRENSRIQLNDPSVEANNSILLFLGRIFARIMPSRTGEPSFSVEGLSVVAGVRGTEFEMAQAMDGSALVSVEEGEVEVSGEENLVSVKQGEEVEVSPERKWQKRKRKARTPEEWRSWFQAREQFFIQHSSRLIDNFYQRATRIQTRIKAQDQKLKEKSQVLKTAYEQKHLTYFQARRIARKEIRGYMKMLKALARSDRQLVALNYIIYKAEKEIEQSPEAFSEEFKQSIAQAREKLNQLNLKQLHKQNQKIIRSHLILLVATAKKFHLEKELWRNLPPQVRKRILEKARKSKKGKKT